MVLKGLAIALLLNAGTGGVASEMFGGNKRTYVAPDRLYALSVPVGWNVIKGNNPHEIQLAPEGPGDPVLFIRRIDVPAGADPMQLAMRALDLRLSKMPGFNLQARRRVTMAGHPAVSLTGNYAFQGNIQFPRVVEEVYLVVGNEAFIFHFECSGTRTQDYISGLTLVYSSFVPRPAEAPPTPATSEALPEVENIPF